MENGTKYLAFLNGVIVGPYGLAQIKKMLEDGVLGLQDKVCLEGELAWKTPIAFPELAAHANKGHQKTTASLAVAGGKNQLPVASEQQLDPSGDLRFRCPHCRQSYSINSSRFRGQAIRCQVCNNQFLLKLEITEPEEGSSPNSVPGKGSGVDFTEEVPEGDITCPHCWKTFSKENVRYIASHPDLVGDSIAGEFEQKRFVPTVFHSNGLPLDARGMPCTDMACPHCHLRIPASIVDLSSTYISIAGAPSSGKSYFLTSMIHQLRKALPENNYSFYDVDPVINSVLNGYEDTIFLSLNPDDVVSLPKTQQIGNDFSNQILKNGIAFELPKPFIFRLQNTNPAAKTRVDRNLVVYDNAGEHFQPGADSISNPATIHLSHSNGIVFLFDPLNDVNMRKGCDQRDPQTALNTKVMDQTTLFAEMVNRIRRHGNFVSGQTCQIPLIVAVGKYDTWKEMLPKDLENLKLFRENQDDLTTELDWSVVLDVSFALRELILNVAPALVAQAEAFFEKVIFVPVSSFGCLASKSESGNIGIIPANLNPIWVDVPIRLLLAENGLLPSFRSACEADVTAEELGCRILDNHIVFKHPVTGVRVSLPALYEKTVLEIAGKKYQLPSMLSSKSVRTVTKKTSVWG